MTLELKVCERTACPACQWSAPGFSARALYGTIGLSAKTFALGRGEAQSATVQYLTVGALSEGGEDQPGSHVPARPLPPYVRTWPTRRTRSRGGLHPINLQRTFFLWRVALPLSWSSFPPQRSC